MKLWFYEDPGHGWLAVKRETLTRLGIADKISCYSYQRGKTVYLEEDCDASTFFAACKAQAIPIEVATRNSPIKRSPIRSYEHYTQGESK